MDDAAFQAAPEFIEMSPLKNHFFFLGGDDGNSDRSSMIYGGAADISRACAMDVGGSIGVERKRSAKTCFLFLYVAESPCSMLLACCARVGCDVFVR